MGTSALYASRADAMGIACMLESETWNHSIFIGRSGDFALYHCVGSRKYEQVKKVSDFDKSQIVMARQSPKRQILWGVPSM